MSHSTLRRQYYFSDTYGGPTDPMQKPDADALMCTDFRSNPLEKVRREFDIYGQSAVTAHLLRLVLEEHDRVNHSPYFSRKIKEEFNETKTGVFINTAERTTAAKNGDPFYIATAKGGSVRVVTTPLSPLSAIKEHIETLEELPNTRNGLYGDTEQFRSSYTPYLLHGHHGLDTIKHDPNSIPDPETDLHVAYVDRFGNIVTYAGEDELMQLSELLSDSDAVNIEIGDVRERALVTTSLGMAKPGSLSFYKNGHFDIVRRWKENQSHQDRLDSSAYRTFQKPKIGEIIRIDPIDATS